MTIAISHRRENTFNNIETQSMTSSEAFNTTITNRSIISRANPTVPQPFHLSRSNSRKAKEVLISLKIENDKKEEEELER